MNNQINSYILHRECLTNGKELPALVPDRRRAAQLQSEARFRPIVWGALICSAAFLPCTYHIWKHRYLGSEFKFSPYSPVLNPLYPSMALSPNVLNRMMESTTKLMYSASNLGHGLGEASMALEAIAIWGVIIECHLSPVFVLLSASFVGNV